MADSNNNKSLPPSKDATTKHGHLTIAIQGLTFFTQNKQNCIIKLLFWGATTPTYLPLNSSQTFQIVAPMNMFKTYLVDCKATQFEIVDSRNYKPIASAFLNWTPFLRSLEDRQTYVDKQDNAYLRDRSQMKTFYLPFFDQILSQTLPLYHFTANSHTKRQQKIGEMIVKWSCRMFQPQHAQPNTAANINNSGSNLYNIRVSQISNNNTRKNDPNPVPISICNIQIQDDPNQDVRTNRSILSKQRQNSPKIYTSEHPAMQRRSNVSILDSYAGNLKRVREQPEIDQSRTSNDRGKGINQLDLQLIRMRMEMEELVGPNNTKVQSSILQIVHFQTVSKSFSIKQLSFCDIKSQGNNKGSHWRIFPQNTTQDKTFFNSTLSIKPGSLLTFSLGMKKGKEIYKGSMPIDCIRDSYDINIISSLGPIVGYLRVKNERKTQINVKQVISQQKNLENQQNLNKPLSFIPPVIPKILNNSMKLAENNYKSQKIHDPQAFFLFNIQMMKKSKHKDLSFKVFDVMISQYNPQKISFVSQREYINKPLVINVYQKDKQLYQQVLIKQLKKTTFATVNLTCSLIFQTIIQQLQINCQLYAGNLKQINYFIQKLSAQSQQRQQRQVTEPPFQVNHPIKTQQSNKNSIIGQYQMQNTQQERRKMKTQGIGLEQRDRRLTEQKVSGESVAMEKFQMHSQNQGNQEQNIYLVDLLTRFLDFLPENILPEVQQLSKQRFIELITPKLKTSNFQIELVQIIVSIFQDMNGDNLSILQLAQCQKAYRSFLNIYHQQKQATIKQILQVQPRAVQRIKNNSQFGTLNESMLWGRALSKVKDSSIKLKLNKFYKISSFGTTDAAPLLDDLQLKVKELRPLDISNLGMMIKDWVQQFISNAQLQKILNIKQKILSSGEQDNYLNIRSISDVIEFTLELRLSLWQSLMLIQEIKGSYGCDLQLQEGVISGQSLLNWIDIVKKRTRQRTQNSRLSDSHASIDPEELAVIKQINNQNRNGSEMKRKEIAHKSESRSMVGVNNDSDIADIANLLREKDGLMQLEFMEQTKTKHIRENQSLDPDQRIIKDSLRIQNENLEIIMNKRKKEEIKQVIPTKNQKNQRQKELQKVAKQRQKLKQMTFYLQVKQFKIYNEKMPQKLIKALFLLQNANSQPSQDSFFYLTSKNNFSQANQSVIKYCIDKTAKFQHKGIKIVLNDQSNKLMYNGFLPFEEINDWFVKNQADCKRTIVLYEAKGKIGGKLVVNLMLNNDKYERNQENVNRMNISQKINLTLHKVTPSLKGLKLFARNNQQQSQQLYLNQQTQITFNKPIYHCELTIGDDSQSCTAIISLQQLYLKHYIHQSYPLIDVNGGNFIATITLTLTYNYTGPKIHEKVMKKQFQQNFDYLIPKQEIYQEKRSIMSQIDDIYESLKMRCP